MKTATIVITLLFLSGCSFFGDRVVEYDEKIEQQEKLLDQLRAELRAMPMPIDDRPVDSAIEQQREQLSQFVRDAEERLRGYAEQRDRALNGKEKETEWARELAALVLGIGSGVLSAAVGGARKTVGA